MKIINFLLAVIILTGAFSTGCKEAPPPPPPPTPQEELPPPPPPEPVAPDDATQIALINAVINNDLRFIQAQLDRPLIVDSPLQIRTMENALSFRESLKKYQFLYDNIRRDTDDITLLFLAVATDKKPIFDIVMQKNPDINLPSFKNVTPYEMATMNSNSEIIKVLLEKGATPSLIGDDNDIVKAIKRKDYDSAKLLLNYAKNNDINMAPYLPSLTDAITASDTRLLTFLVDQAAIDPNKPDMKTLQYPMIDAVIQKNQDMVKMLLAAGASLDITDGRGRLPLAIMVDEVKNARTDGAVKTAMNFATFLITNGADVNFANDKGETVLFEAVKAGHEGFIDVLLLNGADINIRNKKGESVLFIAVEKSDINAVNMLLKKGINKNIKNRQGVDAATVAAQLGNMDIFDAISNYRPA